MDWIKKNPLYTGLIGVGAVVLIVLILYFTGVFGGGGQTAPAANGTTATTGATTGATGATTATTGSAGTGATTGASVGTTGGLGQGMGGTAGGTGGGTMMVGAGGGGPDQLPKLAKESGGRPNPMKPFWVSRVLPPVVVPPPIFTPPTPSVFGRGNVFGPNGRLVNPNQPPLPEIQPAQRMSGVLFSNDRVLAIVEQQGAERGMVVQPGEILNNGRVVAISPTSVTVERNGKREEIPLTPGSLNNLPPATSLRGGGGATNPGGAFGAGLPGSFFGGPPGGSGYPGAGPSGSPKFPPM